MREALDPHVHYKKNILNRIPKFSQVQPTIPIVSILLSNPLTLILLTPVSTLLIPAPSPYIQMGTIVADHSEFYSSRLTNKERKKSILEEVMSSKATTDRFKRKRNELEAKSRAGGWEHYKKLKEKRKRK